MKVKFRFYDGHIFYIYIYVKNNDDYSSYVFTSAPVLYGQTVNHKIGSDSRITVQSKYNKYKPLVWDISVDLETLKQCIYEGNPI